ncbi:MAG TPA: ABC transporter substrate binding protein [Rhodocyclaceae bacterium]|nr:ABC transporter substrate binding protein [Rhodocyclaceae bacterium]
MPFLAVLWAAGVGAESRALIVREDSAVSRQTAEIVTRDLTSSGWTLAEVTVGFETPLPPHPEQEQAIIALGARALIAAIRHAGGKPVVAALIGQSSVDEMTWSTGDRLSVILLDQPVDRWINLVQTAFPNLQQVGMVAGPANQKMAKAVERRMSDRRLALSVEQISSPEEVVPALERLLPRMGLFLALPDPMVHNRNSVQPLLLTTYRAGIPVVAYSESYLQAGAVLALYSTVPQIAAQVIETLQQFQEGKPPPTVQPPRYFTVGVNSAVARSLGLSLPSGADLTARLRSQGQ